MERKSLSVQSGPNFMASKNGIHFARNQRFLHSVSLNEFFFSVCYSNCNEKYTVKYFNSLIFKDYALSELSYLTGKRFCGFQMDENDSVLELKNQNAESLQDKSLLCTEEADQGKSIYSSVQADTKDDIQRSIYIGVISTCGFVIVILTLAICHLKRKLNSFTSKADEDRNNVMNSSFNIIDTTQPDLQNVHTRRPAYQFSFNPYFQ